MRKTIMALVLSLGFVFSVASNLQAQNSDRRIMDVPFSFIANGAELPAGTYIVSRASEDELNTLVIRSVDGSQAAFLSSNFAGTPDSKVVFDLVGDQHYLRQVSTANSRHAIPQSRAESQAQARMTMSASNSSSSGK